MAEDEATQWRSIAESLGTTLPPPRPAAAVDGAGNPPSRPQLPLIKYLMEQVYKEIKTQFSEAAEISISDSGGDASSFVVSAEDALEIAKVSGRYVVLLF